MTNNPFNKPFNTWTIEDFQDALKITATKQNESKQVVANMSQSFIGLPIPPTVDIVELERGEPIIEKQSKIKDNKYTRMKAFHKELQVFINTLQGKNGRLDVKTIKRAIDRLPRTHSIHTTYKAYLEKCRWKQRQHQLEKWGTTGRFWDLTDYDRISKHMKYMAGYTQEFSHKARHGCGGTRVNVYKKYIVLTRY